MLVSLTIPGEPPRKNSKHEVFVRTGKMRGGQRSIGRRLTADYRRFREVVALAWDRVRAREKLQRITAGRWEITVRAYWSRERHLDVDFAIGDVDAPLECVLDALHDEDGANALDDDVRFVKLTATKHYDPRYPRVEVEIYEAPPEGQLPLYTPSPEERDDW